jgi:hypothetical protein
MIKATIHDMNAKRVLVYHARPQYRFLYHGQKFLAFRQIQASVFLIIFMTINPRCFFSSLFSLLLKEKDDAKLQK